jgi:hypothetical protein
MMKPCTHLALNKPELFCSGKCYLISRTDRPSTLLKTQTLTLCLVAKPKVVDEQFVLAVVFVE